MLCLVLTLIGSIFLSISTVAFPLGFIYSNQCAKWHIGSVTVPPYYSKSQDEASVELNNHLAAHTNTIRVRAPYLFCFPEGETVARLPVIDRCDCSVEILDTLMEYPPGRDRGLVIWSLERARTFKCCGMTIPKELPGSYDLLIEIETDVAASIIRLRCGDRQKQAGDLFRGPSTVKLSRIKASVLKS